MGCRFVSLTGFMVPIRVLMDLFFYVCIFESVFNVSIYNTHNIYNTQGLSPTLLAVICISALLSLSLCLDFCIFMSHLA